MLATDWVQMHHATSGKKYWKNSSTGRVSMTDPSLQQEKGKSSIKGGGVAFEAVGESKQYTPRPKTQNGSSSSSIRSSTSVNFSFSSDDSISWIDVVGKKCIQLLLQEEEDSNRKLNRFKHEGEESPGSRPVVRSDLDILNSSDVRSNDNVGPRHSTVLKMKAGGVHEVSFDMNGGWIEKRHQSSDRPYWKNKLTGQVTMVDPKQLLTTQSSSSSSSCAGFATSDSLQIQQEQLMGDTSMADTELTMDSVDFEPIPQEETDAAEYEVKLRDVDDAVVNGGKLRDKADAEVDGEANPNVVRKLDGSTLIAASYESWKDPSRHIGIVEIIWAVVCIVIAVCCTAVYFLWEQPDSVARGSTSTAAGLGLNWTFIQRRDEVDCFVARIVGSPLTASRGVTVVDGRVAHVVGTFLDVERLSSVRTPISSNSSSLHPIPAARKDDITAMEENNNSVTGKLSELIKRISQVPEHSTLVNTRARGNGALNTQLVYQYFDLTWPLLDRDLLLRQETILYRPDKKVTDSTFISREHCCFV